MLHEFAAPTLGHCVNGVGGSALAVVASIAANVPNPAITTHATASVKNFLRADPIRRPPIRRRPYSPPTGGYSHAVGRVEAFVPDGRPDMGAVGVARVTAM